MNVFTWDTRLYTRQEEWALPPLLNSDTYIHRIRTDGNLPIDYFLSTFAAMYRLSGSQPFEKLLVLCHGTPGVLQFSSTGIDSNNVHLLLPLRGKIRKIKLVGCRVADGTAGEVFCRSLANVTDAFVTASSDTQYINSVDEPNRWEGTVYRFSPAGEKRLASHSERH